MTNPNLFTPETIAAAVGAFLAFVFAIGTNFLWQMYLDKRNKIQITYSTNVTVPLSIAKKELNEKLTILYNGEPIKDIYYSKLSIKNTGQKTIRNQIFTCTFNENSKPIDSNFPLVTTFPENEVPIHNISKDDQSIRPNAIRYKIDVLGIGQSVQVDFLRDGVEKDFKVLFRPNEFDEVKFFEGSGTSNITLQDYIIQIGFNLFIYTAVVRIGSTLNFIPFGNLFVLLFALPYLYSIFVAFKKAVPLAFESGLFGNKGTEYQIGSIEIGNEAQSGVVIGDGSVKIMPKRKEEKTDK